jgi:endonuclease G
MGTGFLVSPRLLLTNHHVLSTPDEATRSTVIFRYREDSQHRISGARAYKLDPDQQILIDEMLGGTQ